MTFYPSALFHGKKKKKRILGVDCDLIHFPFFLCCSFFPLSPTPSPKVHKMALVDLDYHSLSAKHSQVRSEFRYGNK